MKRATTKTFTNGSRGFTLLELLAAIAILVVLSGLLFAAFSQASRGWLLAESRVETFTQARAALDFMAKELSQAMVNSNLQFLANANSLAFIAPLNETTNAVDLTEVVYRLSIKKTGAAADPTGVFIDSNPPYHLVRRASVIDSVGCQDYGNNGACAGSGCFTYVFPPWDFYCGGNWPSTSDTNRTAMLADNIISIKYTFFNTNGTSSVFWNSTSGLRWGNELPSVIPIGNLTMRSRAPSGVAIEIVAIDGRSAAKIKSVVPFNVALFNTVTNQSAQTFSTYIAIPNRQP